MRTFTVWHFRNADGTWTARCFAFKGWKTTSSTLEESYARAETELRSRVGQTGRFQHFERAPYGSAAA